MPQIGHTGWKVISIDPSAYVTTASGDLQYGYRVRFETGAGNKGTVFLRQEDFVPVNVGNAIDVQAAIIDTVGNMNTPPTNMEF